jgi:hypothetical protein
MKRYTHTHTHTHTHKVSESLRTGLLLFAAVLSASAAQGDIVVEHRTTNNTVFFGTASLPPGVMFPNAELIYSSQTLSLDFATALSGFAGFPPGSTFGQQLIDDWVGQSTIEILLNGGFVGDPELALLAAFNAYEQDLESETGMEFVLTIGASALVDTVATDLDGGVLTSVDVSVVQPLDSVLAQRIIDGEKIHITGTVETDFWRIDASFHAVPEPTIMSRAACGAVLFTLATACRRWWRHCRATR